MEKLIKLLLCAGAIINLLYAVRAHYETSTNLASTQINEISPEIVNELRDFLGLIPEATVDAIVAKHYIIDGEFRRAITFLRSAQFKQLLLYAEQIPEVIEILNFLHLNVVANATPPAVAPTWAGYAIWRPTVDNVRQTPTNAIQTEFVLLEYGQDVRHGVGGNDVGIVKQHQPRRRKIFQRNLRTFSTFVEELLGHLPRAAYTQMINEKCQRSTAFAQFYVALRSDQLRPLVVATLKSANLSTIIRTLSSNDVDANGLVPIAFEVISWGPTPAAVSVATATTDANVE